MELPTSSSWAPKASGAPTAGCSMACSVHLEHGFFNYQPNLFAALARFNSYKTIGIWIGPDWTLSSLVPWEPRLLDFLVLNSKTTHLLLVLQQKQHDTEFCVPIQGVYETMIPDSSAERYRLVVDGEYYSGHRYTHIVKAPSSPRIGGLDEFRGK